ncbi:MAG TPA: sugar ABC transporter substrate-binding protein [Candidatus Pelethocola excrementipullorum]|nr:sugar ABC transporter substrate-binding protein [Candidatus Pelethocola excrementipullorum]
MNKKRIIISAIIFLLILMVFPVFDGGKVYQKRTGNTKEIYNKEGEGNIVIGVSLPDEDSYYIKEICSRMKKRAAEEKVELQVEYADWNVETQSRQLQNFVKKGVDVIILCPVNAKSMLMSLKEIEKSEIPVINLNMRVDAVSSIYVDSYIGANNSEEAAMAAEMIKEMLGEEGGDIAIIEGAPGSDTQIYRTQTFVERMASSPEIQIVGIGNGEWNREKAGLVAYDLITKNPGLKAIYCHDSEMAMGAIETIESLEISGEVQVIGISEKTEFIEAVKDGRLYGFISQPSDFEANTCIEKAIDAAKGKKLRTWYKDPIEAVTKQNIESFEKEYTEMKK